jgi:putative phosphoesterase
MRIAIVADIHGNLTAFEAVVSDIGRRAPDVVVQGGDLALMGPRPAEVIDRVRALGWPGVVGNTDELLWRPEGHECQLERAPQLEPLLSLLFGPFAADTGERLGEERIEWLKALPTEHREGELCLVHARPGDLWRAPMPEATDDELHAAYDELQASQVVFGHIHRQFARVVGSLTVANTGSVGMPWDGDRRAAYLLIDNGNPELIRVEYDVEAEIAALYAAGHPDADRLAAMRRTGRFITPRPSGG